MFLCQPCLEENFKNYGIVQSKGRCEYCEKECMCYDIPSSQLKRRPEVKKEYTIIDFNAGTTVERAVNELLEYRKNGQLACTEFNGTMLYSDTVEMDDAYMKIVGHSKAAHDKMAEDAYLRIKKMQDDYEEQIPELIEKWIAKGNEVLDAEKQAFWAAAVPVQLKDAYRELVLRDSLEIIEILNKGGSLGEAEDALNKQSHSGMSRSSVIFMVRACCDKGLEFSEHILTRRTGWRD